MYVSEETALESPLPQPRVDALAALAETSGADAVLFAASVLAADVAAGLAARLDAGLNWDLTDLVLEGDELVGKRPASGTPCSSTSVDRLAAPRNGAIRRRGRRGDRRYRRGRVVRAHVLGLLDARDARRTDAGGVERTSIEDADIIVAGGRGLGAPDAFSVLEEFAGALGGAVAATRAVVDAGWYPYATQVGQTGKTVSPKLYVACGISKAIQHKVGMQSAGTIVAINKDPERADLRLLRLRRRRRPASDRPQADRARAHPPGELEA